MQITYLNRQGGGFAQKIDLEDGTTVEQFVEEQGLDADAFKIRIIRQNDAFTPTADEILQDGDRLSCVPLNIKGA